MILNSYAVLDAFISLLRLPLALVVVGLAISTWRQAGVSLTSAGQKGWEDRCYLLLMLAILLLGLNLVAWPLFYALLQSYVPQWPGVMCIYGVTKIGSGSQGASRFLPGLLTALQVTKPAVVFVSGAWFVLYLLNRRTRTSPLMQRVLLLLLAFGLLTATDAALEGAYLVIPKKERFLDSGCCTAVLDGSARAARFLPGALFSERGDRWLAWAYYGVNGFMALALLGRLLLGPRPSEGRWLLPLLVGTLVAVPISLAFLIEIAAPAILRLPYHHCPYDLLPQAPESVVGIALFLLGCFSVGWAALVAWSGRVAETTGFLRETVDRMLFLALFGFLASLVLISVELVLV